MPVAIPPPIEPPPPVDPNLVVFPWNDGSPDKISVTRIFVAGGSYLSIAPDPNNTGVERSRYVGIISTNGLYSDISLVRQTPWLPPVTFGYFAPPAIGIFRTFGEEPVNVPQRDAAAFKIGFEWQGNGNSHKLTYTLNNGEAITHDSYSPGSTSIPTDAGTYVFKIISFVCNGTGLKYAPNIKSFTVIVS